MGRNGSEDTKAPTGSALTGSVPSKDTKALTGSNAESAKAESPQSHSRCAPFHELILSKLEQGLDRFLHHAELIQINGKSYRLDKSQKTSKGTKAPTGSDAEKE